MGVGIGGSWRGDGERARFVLRCLQLCTMLISAWLRDASLRLITGHGVGPTSLALSRRAPRGARRLLRLVGPSLPEAGHQGTLDVALIIRISTQYEDHEVLRNPLIEGCEACEEVHCFGKRLVVEPAPMEFRLPWTTIPPEMRRMARSQLLCPCDGESILPRPRRSHLVCACGGPP